MLVAAASMQMPRTPGARPPVESRGSRVLDAGANGVRIKNSDQGCTANHGAPGGAQRLIGPVANGSAMHAHAAQLGR
jgi:hypothetical protein